jgi:hypothetical protein
VDWAELEDVPLGLEDDGDELVLRLERKGGGQRLETASLKGQRRRRGGGGGTPCDCFGEVLAAGEGEGQLCEDDAEGCVRLREAEGVGEGWDDV